MAFVFDASAILACLLPDETSSLGDWLLEAIQSEGAVVPELLWLELANTLVVAEQRGRLAEGEGDALVRLVLGANVTTDREPNPGEVLKVARLHGLTAYDAAYLELAVRLELPLASLDEQLLAALDAAGGVRYGAT